MDELRFDAGRVCLDLLATAHPLERLAAVAPLCAWIRGCGLVPPDTPLTHAGPSWPPAFRELRRDTGRLVHGWLAGNEPGSYGQALARVNEAARAAPPTPVPCPVKTEVSSASWPGRPRAPRCWPPWPGTRWSCSPIR